MIRAPPHAGKIVKKFTHCFWEFLERNHWFNDDKIEDKNQTFDIMSSYIQTFKEQSTDDEETDEDEETESNEDTIMEIDRENQHTIMDLDDDHVYDAEGAQTPKNKDSRPARRGRGMLGAVGLGAVGLGGGRGGASGGTSRGGSTSGRKTKAKELLADVILPDPNTPIGITVDLSVNCGRAELEVIRANALKRLSGLQVIITNKNRDEQRTIDSLTAIKIVKAFFKTMLGGLPQRIKTVVKSAPEFNSAYAANRQADRRDVPDEAKRVLRDLSSLAYPEQRDFLSPIIRMVYYVKLSQHWAELKHHIQEDTPVARELLELAPLALHGQTRVSQTRDVVCILAKMSGEKFDSYLKSAALVTAMVETWGRGAILFCTTGASGGRGGIPWASAASAIFAQIDPADPGQHITSTARLLQARIIDSMWEEEPFDWDTNQIREVPTNKPVATVMELLRPLK